MANSQNKKAQAGSLRALGGDGNQYDLGDPEKNSAAQKLLDGPPTDTALAALGKLGGDVKGLIRLMISHGVFTATQRTIVAGAIEVEAQANPRETKDASLGNYEVWHFVNGATENVRDRLTVLLIDTGGDIDFYA